MYGHIMSLYITLSTLIIRDYLATVERVRHITVRMPKSSTLCVFASVYIRTARHIETGGGGLQYHYS